MASLGGSAVDGSMSQAENDVTCVRLAPYKETPEWYRTTVKVEGAKRWFEKSKVSVVLRNDDSVVLAMPKSYANTRVGISSLIVEDDDGATRCRAAPAQESSGFNESSLPERLDVYIGPGGRVVIPAVFRDAMQVKEGDRLMARVVDGELRLITPRMGVKLAQKIAREMICGDESLVDTLMDMRRREVADELGDG